MKIYTGTDIIEVNRIQKAMQDENFKEKVFTKTEIEYCEKFGDKKYQHYAARFAAKEAVFKALSPELANKYDIAWKSIEIEKAKDGRPVVKIIADDDAEKRLTMIVEKIKEENMVIDVSLSHLESYAIATVTVVVK